MGPDPKKKTVRLKGKAYHDLRVEAWDRAAGRCHDCGKFVPLLTPGGGFNVFTCAHLAHIKSRGAGGSDILSNVVIKCYQCHIEIEHGGRWSGSK